MNFAVGVLVFNANHFFCRSIGFLLGELQITIDQRSKSADQLVERGAIRLVIADGL